MHAKGRRTAAKDAPAGSRRILYRRAEPLRVQRAANTYTGLGHHVRVDHRRSDVLVAEQLLHRPNVAAVFQQVRGEGMPQRMAGHAFVDACNFSRLLARAIVVKTEKLIHPAAVCLDGSWGQAADLPGRFVLFKQLHLLSVPRKNCSVNSRRRFDASLAPP